MMYHLLILEDFKSSLLQMTMHSSTSELRDITIN